MTTSESDYQVGRRVEQLAIAGGTVRRMTVSVVVKQPLSDAQLDKLKEVVGLAVGFSAARGDAIVVNSMDRLVAAAPAPVAAVPALAGVEVAEVPAPARARPDQASVNVVIWVLAGLLALIVAGALVWVGSRRSAPKHPQTLVLDDAAREKMLVDVRSWIAMQSLDDAVSGVRK